MKKILIFVLVILAGTNLYAQFGNPPSPIPDDPNTPNCNEAQVRNCDIAYNYYANNLYNNYLSNIYNCMTYYDNDLNDLRDVFFDWGEQWSPGDIPDLWDMFDGLFEDLWDQEQGIENVENCLLMQDQYFADNYIPIVEDWNNCIISVCPDWFD